MLSFLKSKKLTLTQLEKALDNVDNERALLDFAIEYNFELKGKLTDNAIGLVYQSKEYTVCYNIQKSRAMIIKVSDLSVAETLYPLVLMSEQKNITIKESQLRIAPFLMQYVYGQLYGELLIDTNFEVWPYGILNDEIYRLTRVSSNYKKEISRESFEKYALDDYKRTKSALKRGQFSKLEKTNVIVIELIKNLDGIEAASIMAENLGFSVTDKYIPHSLFIKEVVGMKEKLGGIYEVSKQSRSTPMAK